MVFISRSKIGLQNCLKHLESFCSTWLLEASLKKTKIMIFQKCGRKPKNLHFYYQNQLIEIVQEYTYLGIKLTPNGKFTMAQKRLCEKSFASHFHISKLPHRLVFKIFDATVLPILTYGGEVWGVSKHANFKKWDQSHAEKIHLKFCKHYLELNRKASNSATRSELGRLPIQITLVKKSLKYYSYLCGKDQNTIVKQAFLISKDLDLENKRSYISELKSFLRGTGCYTNTENLDSIRTSTIAQIMRKLENNYLNFWQEEINTSMKLDFYLLYKTGFCTSSYVDILRNTQIRKDFIKFCISNHNLCIEVGRHCKPKVPREERLCKVCMQNEIEDEIHILFHCTKYECIRKQFIAKQSRILNLTSFDDLKNYVISSSQHLTKLQFIVLLSILANASC